MNFFRRFTAAFLILAALFLAYAPRTAVAGSQALSGEWTMTIGTTKETFTLKLGMNKSKSQGYGKFFNRSKEVKFSFVPGETITFIIGSPALQEVQGKYVLRMDGVSLSGQYHPRKETQGAPIPYTVSGSKNFN